MWRICDFKSVTQRAIYLLDFAYKKEEELHRVAIAYVVTFVATQPVCSSNISETGYSVSGSDSLAVSCEVEFSGNLSPVVTCLINTPGQVAVTDRRQALSRFIMYHKVVAMAAALKDQQLTCRISFNNTISTTGEHRVGVDLPQTSFSFNWTSPRIRIIHSGKFALLLLLLLLLLFGLL